MPKNINDQAWKRILANPTLFSDALTAGDRDVNWHNFAASENSSQAFCFSAFGTLRNFESTVRNSIVAGFVTRCYPEMKTAARPRSWEVQCEVERPELLGEFGSNQPTSIDVLLTSSTEVVAVESKFDSDANEGLGKCSQVGRSICRGFYGPTSSSGGSSWCTLEQWAGSRSPRYYWSLGKTYFKPQVFQMQTIGDKCPFSDGSYQLMRNFLFAAAYAAREGKKGFGVIVICPQFRSDLVVEQVEGFRKNILQDQFSDRVAFCTYETYIQELYRHGSLAAQRLAAFLAERIQKVITR